MINDYFINARQLPELPPDIRRALDDVASYVKQQQNRADVASDGDVEMNDP